MLNLLYARAGQDIRGELLERMSRSPARRRLLIVPEQYSPETLERLQTLGSEVHRTDEEGSVTVRVRDGQVGIF